MCKYNTIKRTRMFCAAGRSHTRLAQDPKQGPKQRTQQRSAKSSLLPSTGGESGNPKTEIIQERITRMENRRTAMQMLLYQVVIPGNGQVVAAKRISTTAGSWLHAAHLRPTRRIRTHARTRDRMPYLHAHAGQPCLAYFRYHISGRSRRYTRSITRIVAAAEPSFSLFRPRGSPPAPKWSSNPFVAAEQSHAAGASKLLRGSRKARCGAELRRARFQIARQSPKPEWRRRSYVSRAIVPRSAAERRGHQATTGPTRFEGLPRRQGADVLRNTAKPRFYLLRWWRCCSAAYPPRPSSRRPVNGDGTECLWVIPQARSDSLGCTATPPSPSRKYAPFAAAASRCGGNDAACEPHGVMHHTLPLPPQNARACDTEERTTASGIGCDDAAWRSAPRQRMFHHTRCLNIYIKSSIYMGVSHRTIIGFFVCIHFFSRTMLILHLCDLLENCIHLIFRYLPYFARRFIHLDFTIQIYNVKNL